MGSVFKFALAAALMLAVLPAFAQTPTTLPPGAQNPAVTQPRLVPPPQLVPPSQPGPQPDASSPNALIIPGGAGGLCECLNSHSLSAAAFDKTHLHQSCLASVDACQAACNTQYLFSYVPHSVFTCPARPGEETGRVAANTRPAVRLLSAR